MCGVRTVAANNLCRTCTYVDDAPPVRVPIDECHNPCDGDLTVRCGGYE
jgi:hypothetical protein